MGAFLTEEEAKAKAAETGWTYKEDAGRGWRQVVASPKPRRIVESDAIRDLFDAGYVVVCTGGGGVPVFEANDAYTGVPAVIDKDRSAAMMAATFDADMLVILTAVEKVAVNFGRQARPRPTSTSWTPPSPRVHRAGPVRPGSMLPSCKVLLSTWRPAPGRALITRFECAAAGLRGETGTVITGV